VEAFIYRSSRSPLTASIIGYQAGSWHNLEWWTWCLLNEQYICHAELRFMFLITHRPKTSINTCPLFSGRACMPENNFLHLLPRTMSTLHRPLVLRTIIPYRPFMFRLVATLVELLQIITFENNHFILPIDGYPKYFQVHLP
jgi:hypothetical protein